MYTLQPEGKSSSELPVGYIIQSISLAFNISHAVSYNMKQMSVIVTDMGPYSTNKSTRSSRAIRTVEVYEATVCVMQ